MKFYNQEDYQKLLKQKKLNLLFIIGFAILFVLVLVGLIIASSYKTRMLFSIITSVIELTVVVFILFFIGKYLYLRRISNEYKILLESNPTYINCTILACSDFLTTLPDKSRCYEVLIQKEDKQSIFYLSEIFDRENIKLENCEISISNDYIVGVKYED